MEIIIFEHLKEDITVICCEESNHGKKYRFLKTRRNHLKKLSLNFSSRNPFPSEPSAAKDACLQFQCTSIAIVNENGPLFLGFLQYKYKFWLFKNLVKSITKPLKPTIGGPISLAFLFKIRLQ